MNWFTKLLRWGLFGAFFAALGGVALLAAAYLYVADDLPQTDSLRDVKLEVPLRIYSADGLLIGQFGEKRRLPLAIEDIPERLRAAFLAAEDDRFYEHPGVDYQGLLRAAIELARTGKRRQGGSTITMQLARNFFLSREKTYIRKIKEIFLALRMERDLSKDEILALYLNKIYLGNRAYGIGAAAKVYYGKSVDQLTLAESAMIAGLPKAPSRYNPLANPSRAQTRRNYVLGRMADLDIIDKDTLINASTAPLTAARHGAAIDLDSPYVAEMVRADLIEQWGEAIYTDGFEATTTIRSDVQQAAHRALRNGLDNYTKRQGYSGPAGSIELPENLFDLDTALSAYPRIGDLHAGVVTEVGGNTAFVDLRGIGPVQVDWEGLRWARQYRPDKLNTAKAGTASAMLAPGDVIYLCAGLGDWQLAQPPLAQGAVVAMNAYTGGILALSGGYDFYTSKFNRAAQAERQIGSSFKPFLYSAALDAGLTPATVLNDAPVVHYSEERAELWRPQNYGKRFYGPTRLRVALAKSRNLISIRLLEQLGVKPVHSFVQRFGFTADELPPDLSLSLGSNSTTPIKLASAYSVFANGGFPVEPYLIQTVSRAGETLFKAPAFELCADCGPDKPPSDGQTERVLTPSLHYQIVSMMREVVRTGTARKAQQLGRDDIAGKTGTTNEQRDAWFSGFAPGLVGIAWVGHDNNTPLGRGETGGRAALPIWMDTMKVALKDYPVQDFEKPADIITIPIDPGSGLQVDEDTAGALLETFRAEYLPPRAARTAVESATQRKQIESLF